MPLPFLRLGKDEFTAAVAEFAWPTPKTEIHVHHTWRPNHAQYRGERSIRAMHNYHTVTLGWSDIAQHVSIGPDGSIWTGRAWGRSPASASGHNGAHVFMFETIGDFDRGRDPLTGDQLDAVLHVVATLQERFDLPPDASIRFHNEMSSKSCPGHSVDRDAFVAQVAEYRAGRDGARLFAQARSARTETLSALSQAGSEALGDDGDAELEHSPALARFMEERAANPFLRDGATTETATGANAVAAAALDLANAAAAGAGTEALYAELGRRAQMIIADPARAGMATPEMPALTEGVFGDFADLGKRIFARVERELHRLMCGGDGSDAADRARLREAFGLGGDALTGAIVAALTGTLGLAPAVAAVVAALLIRVALKPAYEETCVFWGARLAG